MNGMTTEGIIFMVMAWSIIFGLVGYCYYRVLTDKNK